jgi:hypothetical protein
MTIPLTGDAVVPAAAKVTTTVTPVIAPDGFTYTVTAPNRAAIPTAVVGDVTNMTVNHPPAADGARRRTMLGRLFDRICGIRPQVTSVQTTVGSE